MQANPNSYQEQNPVRKLVLCESWMELSQNDLLCYYSVYEFWVKSSELGLWWFDSACPATKTSRTAKTTRDRQTRTSFPCNQTSCYEEFDLGELILCLSLAGSQGCILW